MRHFRSFFQKKISKKFSNFVPSRETVIFQSYRVWKAHFGCLESVFKAFHEYVLSIFRKLCASWALDIAPTLDVPVLFFSHNVASNFIKSKFHEFYKLDPACWLGFAVNTDYQITTRPGDKAWEAGVSVFESRTEPSFFMSAEMPLWVCFGTIWLFSNYSSKFPYNFSHK